MLVVSQMKTFIFFCIDALASVHSNYSSELTKESPKYAKECNDRYYYYEAIQLTVFTSGYYRLVMSQVWNGHFYIDIHMYQNHFDPFNPKKNAISIKDYACLRKNEREFAVDLRHDDTYTIVVMTDNHDDVSPFSIAVYGPSNVTLHRISKYQQ